MKTQKSPNLLLRQRGVAVCTRVAIWEKDENSFCNNCLISNGLEDQINILYRWFSGETQKILAKWTSSWTTSQQDPLLHSQYL